MPELKLCKRCNTTKPENEFHLSKKQTLQFWCKSCMVESNKTYQKNKLTRQRKVKLKAKQEIIDAGLKRCAKCKSTLPNTEFNQGQKYCKHCKSAADKKSRMDKNVFPHTYSKVCGRCNLNKSRDAFYPASSTADGRQSYCRKCSREFDKENQEIKKIKRELSKKSYLTPSQYNTQGYFETLRGGKENAGRPSNDLLDLTPERIEFLNQQREYWRQVFAERHDDVVKLMKAYEEEPDNSVQLITDFHDNIRPTWKLNHKTTKQTKDEYYQFLRDKHSSSNIG